MTGVCNLEIEATIAQMLALPSNSVTEGSPVSLIFLSILRCFYMKLTDNLGCKESLCKE